MTLYVKKDFSAFLLKFFLNFHYYKPHGARDLSTNAKPLKSVCAFWSYSARKENPTYFYIVDVRTH